MTILKRQMTKLRSAENVDAAAEGFVFDYDGVTYKFTGNFAPMNQILGLFKYGRGNVPPLQKLNEAKKKGQTVAVVPGAFKPPHKGHLSMIKQYAKLADKVIVMVSPLSRNSKDGLEINFDFSIKLWNIYLESENLLNKVQIIKSPYNSPIKAAYMFVQNTEDNPLYAQKGQTIILGVSTKGGDEERFAHDAQKVAKEGVKVVVTPVQALDNFSARDFREAIKNKNVEQIKKFLPDSLKKKNKVIKDIFLSLNLDITPAKVSENILSVSDISDIIIESVKKKNNKYSLLVKKTKKENMAGSVAGYTAPIGKRVER